MTVAEWRAWHRERQAAVVRFQVVADHVRVLTRLAESAGITDRFLPRGYEEAVRDAERVCADLKIWPHYGGREPHHPERFREIGDREA